MCVKLHKKGYFIKLVYRGTIYIKEKRFSRSFSPRTGLNLPEYIRGVRVVYRFSHGRICRIYSLTPVTTRLPLADLLSPPERKVTV